MTKADLTQFSEEEWEALCDNCGLCCLYKVQDEDTGKIFYTSDLCPFLNKETFRCVCYPERFRKMPTCTKISLESLPKIARWLPKNCAYRCLAEGIALPDWHPLNRSTQPEDVSLREKVAAFCVRPNCCISRETADEIIRNSIVPHSSRKLTRVLLAHVIEDIDI